MAPEQRDYASEQFTLVIIKPDAVRRGIHNEIQDIYEEQDFLVLSELWLENGIPWWEEFYAEHRERDFFPDLVAFMASGPSVALLISGEEDVIRRVRTLHGGVMPEQQPEGSIRQRFMPRGGKLYENVVHASDSPEAAHRELTLVFTHDYTRLVAQSS